MKCYGGGGGGGGQAKQGGGKLSGEELMAKYGKHKVDAINKALEANKKGSSASGGMAKLKVNKLLKLQAGGGLGKLGAHASEGVPPKAKAKKKAKAPAEGVPPPSKKKKAKAPAPEEGVPPQAIAEGIPPQAIAEGIPPVKLYHGDPFPGFAKPVAPQPADMGDMVPVPVPVSVAQFQQARAQMKATLARPPPHTQAHASWKKGGKRSSTTILQDYRQKHSYGYPLQFRPPPR